MTWSNFVSSHLGLPLQKPVLQLLHFPLLTQCLMLKIQITLKPPQGVHRAHFHQAYKPCFIIAHRFVMTLLKWYKVKSLRRWTSWTPRCGLKKSWNIYYLMTDVNIIESYQGCGAISIHMYPKTLLKQGQLIVLIVWLSCPLHALK